MISKSIVNFGNDTSKDGIKADNIIIDMLRGNEMIMS